MVSPSPPSLEAVLATSLDAVIVIEETGLVIDWNGNSERTFGYTRAEALNKQIAHLIIPQDQRAAHFHGMERYLEFGEFNVLGKRSKLSALHQDGYEFPIELAVMVYSGLGNRSFLGFIRDLTQETATAMKIEALNAEVQMLSRLNAMGTAASMIAHELNQPLAAASNYLAACQHLAAKFEGEASIDLNLGMSKAQDAIFRASKVVKTVRQIVGKRPALSSRIPLEAFVNKASRLLEASVPIRPLGSFGRDAEHVFVSQEKVEQVFLNILRNAAEAMHGQLDSKLFVSSKRIGDMIEICIQDSGPGLSESARDHLFSPVRSQKKGGLGIGLSICRTIIEEHGGRIWAGSEATGTEFCFTLPAG